MRIATAVVNWNNPDIPEYFPWIPYGAGDGPLRRGGLRRHRVGPVACRPTPRCSARRSDARGLDLVGAFVGLGFRDADRRDAEIERGPWSIARFLAVNGGTRLIAAEAGDDRRRGEAGHVDEAGGLTDEQWRNLGEGLNELGRRASSRWAWSSCSTTTSGPTSRRRRRPPACSTRPIRRGWAGASTSGTSPTAAATALEMLGRVRGPRARTSTSRTWTARCSPGRRPRRWSFGTGARTLHLPAAGGGDRPRSPRSSRRCGRVGYDGWYVIEQDTMPGRPHGDRRRQPGVPRGAARHLTRSAARRRGSPGRRGSRRSDRESRSVLADR